MKGRILTTVVACLLGISIGILSADAACQKNGKICGGDPANEGDARTNNGDCERACKYGCKYGSDKYKKCVTKKDSNCVTEDEVNQKFKDCTGELWDVTNCKAPGNIVGTCNRGVKFCN